MTDTVGKRKTDQIIVLADDLSGAAELANLAARRGLQAQVMTGLHATKPPAQAEVLAIDLDTRSLRPAQALQVYARAAGILRRWEFAECFLKVDSVLRGHVACATKVFQQSLGKNCALILPANPRYGRTVKDGLLRINGVLLESTLFGTDPHYPRRTSKVAELLDFCQQDWILPDAESEDEVAAAVAGADDACLLVGAASLFVAMLDRRYGIRPEANSQLHLLPAVRRLYLCGSAAGWPQREAAAIAANFQIVRCGEDAFSAPTDALWREIFAGDRPALIGIGSPLIEDLAPQVLLERLALAGQAWVQWHPAGGVIFVEGGATAAALLRRLGWECLKVVAPVAAGISCLAPLADSRWQCFIKPGSYSWPAPFAIGPTCD